MLQPLLRRHNAETSAGHVPRVSSSMSADVRQTLEQLGIEALSRALGSTFWLILASDCGVGMAC